MSSDKNHTESGTNEMPHNGRLLTDYVLKNRINRAELARKMNVSNTSVYQYAESPSLQMGILWKASLALNYNLIAALAELLPVAHPSQREKELEQRIKNLEIELEIKSSIYEKQIERLSIELSNCKNSLGK